MLEGWNVGMGEKGGMEGWNVGMLECWPERLVESQFPNPHPCLSVKSVVYPFAPFAFFCGYFLSFPFDHDHDYHGSSFA